MATDKKIIHESLEYFRLDLLKEKLRMRRLKVEARKVEIARAQCRKRIDEIKNRLQFNLDTYGKELTG